MSEFNNELTFGKYSIMGSNLKLSSTNYEFRYTCCAQMGRGMPNNQGQCASASEERTPILPPRPAVQFHKLKYPGRDVYGLFKSYDQDVETQMSRQSPKEYNLRALSTMEVQQLIRDSKMKLQTAEGARTTDDKTDAKIEVQTNVVSMPPEADQMSSNCPTILEQDNVKTMTQDTHVCEDLQLSNGDGNGDECNNEDEASSFEESEETLTISHEDYPQPTAQWAEIMHSAEMAQQTSITVCQPMDETLTHEASPSVALQFICTHADDFKANDSPRNDTDTKEPLGSDNDSDLDYEMVERQKYINYCQPKTDNSCDDNDITDMTDMPVFVEMERMTTMNLSFVKNTSLMRFTDMTDDAVEDDFEGNQSGNQQINNNSNNFNAIESHNMQILKTCRKYTESEKPKTKTKATSKQRIFNRKKETNNHNHNHNNNYNTNDMKSVRSMNVEKWERVKAVKSSLSSKYMGVQRKSAKITKRNQSRPSYRQNSGISSSPSRATSPITMITLQSQRQNQMDLKRKMEPHTRFSSVLYNKMFTSQKPPLMVKSGKTDITKSSTHTERVKSPKSLRQSAGKDSARKQKNKSLVNSRSIENLKTQKLTIYNKMTMTQERIIQALDELRFSLLQIQIPDCIYEKTKRQRNAFEFCVRFSRNFLYPLKGMIDNFCQMSSDAFNSATSNDACQRVAAIYSLIYQSLHTYQRQLRYFLLDQVPQKLNSLIEMIYTVTTTCLNKGLFDRQDTIIESIQERCTLFLGFIEDMQEERFVQARENFRKLVIKQNKNVQPHSNIKLKMCMNGMNMYEPKVEIKQKTTRPKRLQRKVKQKVSEHSEKQLQQDYDRLLFTSDIRTQIQEFDDDLSEPTNVVFNAKKLNHESSPSISHTEIEATTLNDTKQFQQQHIIETEGENLQKPGELTMNTAFIEALQIVTKEQVRQMLEPFIESLNSMFDKKVVYMDKAAKPHDIFQQPSHNNN